jgi:uncharacterized Tic20 family protein
MDTIDVSGTEIVPATPPSSDEKTLALLCHVLTVFTWIIGPLIIYLLKKDESPFVAEHAKESLNFQITIGLGYIVSIILVLILIGILFLWALGLINLVLVIVAAVRAGEGKAYRYPLSLRFIR